VGGGGGYFFYFLSSMNSMNQELVQ